MAGPTHSVVYLDVSRTELTEMPLAISRRAEEITSSTTGRNLVYRWPHTKTWTLQPINTTTDFSETSVWESLKLGASDFQYDSDYWTLVPEGSRTDQGAAYDFFFSCIVKKENVPKGWPYKADPAAPFLVGGSTNQGGFNPTLSKTNLQQDHGIVHLAGVNEFPVNQGFLLRFHSEGRASFARGALIDFFFGEYMLRLSSNGTGELQQTADHQNYANVYNFRWTEADFVHGRQHLLLIYPHSRNVIDIMTAHSVSHNYQAQDPREFLTNYGGAYRIPGELLYDANGDLIITQSAPIYVRASVEFRPYIQVSKLAFYNGARGSATGEAFLYDSAINLPYSPTLSFSGAADLDINTCHTYYGLVDPATGQYWVPGGSPAVQFAIGFQGLGDIAGPGLGSSKTPEFYGYNVFKGAAYITVARDTQVSDVLGFKLDTGESPEAERCTFDVDNSANSFVTIGGQLVRAGQWENFAQRPEIPIVLANAGDGTVWFEGTVFEIESGEAPSMAPRRLKCEARGMADRMLRKKWSHLMPDFGLDPTDALQRGFFWDDMLKECFAAMGFDPSLQLVIEEANLYRFRLWTEGGAGGTRGGGNSNSSTGHIPVDGSKWKPPPSYPGYEFIAHIIEDVLGWHWCWDKRDHAFHIFKRPTPGNATDLAKLIPKCAFYATTREVVLNPDNRAVRYAHEDLRFHSLRPLHTTIVASSAIYESTLKSKAELSDTINATASGNSAPSDPAISVQERRVSVTYENFNGFASARHPNPDQDSPDFLGGESIAEIELSVPNRECLEFIGRNIFYDQCFGHVAATFRSYWGDPVTANLRKWDLILLDTGRNYESQEWYIDRIEPEVDHDTLPRARYRVTKYRPDAPPPR